jgi:hypothetical protein
MTNSATLQDTKKSHKKKKKKRNPPLEHVDGVNKIEYILENFDFHRVQTTMKALKWKYFNIQTGNYYEPSIDAIRSTARKVLSTAAFEEKTAASGGFFAQRYKGGYLHLLFYVEEETTFLYGVNESASELIGEVERRGLIEN